MNALHTYDQILNENAAAKEALKAIFDVTLFGEKKRLLPIFIAIESDSVIFLHIREAESYEIEVGNKENVFLV